MRGNEKLMDMKPNKWFSLILDDFGFPWDRKSCNKFPSSLEKDFRWTEMESNIASIWMQTVFCKKKSWKTQTKCFRFRRFRISKDFIFVNIVKTRTKSFADSVFVLFCNRLFLRMHFVFLLNWRIDFSIDLFLQF